MAFLFITQLAHRLIPLMHNMWELGIGPESALTWGPWVSHCAAVTAVVLDTRVGHVHICCYLVQQRFGSANWLIYMTMIGCRENISQWRTGFRPQKGSENNGSRVFASG